MALKDITLGQYFPGTSLIHRFDPRAKILFTVLFIATIFLCKNVVSYGLTLVVLLVLIAISRVRPKVFLKGMKPIIFIVICTALLNLFYTSGTVLWSFGILKITEEGLWKAGFMVLRILMLIACTLLLTYTTSPIALTDGLERLLRPLKKVNFPVHDLLCLQHHHQRGRAGQGQRREAHGPRQGAGQGPGLQGPGAGLRHAPHPGPPLL